MLLSLTAAVVWVLVVVTFSRGRHDRTPALPLSRSPVGRQRQTTFLGVCPEVAGPNVAKAPPHRKHCSASTLLEYLLAVSLIRLVMVGVLRGVTASTVEVGHQFKAAAGAGEFCDPVSNPFCSP